MTKEQIEREKLERVAKRIDDIIREEFNKEFGEDAKLYDWDIAIFGKELS